jgi:hypothetical protein
MLYVSKVICSTVTTLMCKATLMCKILMCKETQEYKCVHLVVTHTGFLILCLHFISDMESYCHGIYKLPFRLIPTCNTYILPLSASSHIKNYIARFKRQFIRHKVRHNKYPFPHSSPSSFPNSP